MLTMKTISLLLGFMFISSSVAIDFCNDELIGLLSKCYINGCPPPLEPPTNVQVEPLRISPGDWPCETRCVSAKYDCENWYTYLYNYAFDGSDNIVNNEPDVFVIEKNLTSEKKDYIRYYDPQNKWYVRVYQLYNDGCVYTEHRCIELPAGQEPSTVGCDCVFTWVVSEKIHSKDIQSALDHADSCFDSLKIKALTVKPCC